MSTQELKSRLYALIEGINDSATLQAVYTLLSKKENPSEDWYDDLPEAIQKQLDLAMEEAKKEEGTSHDKVMKEFRQKYLSE